MYSDGRFYRNGASFEQSTLLGTFNAGYFSDMSLLHNAQPPAGGGQADVTLTLVDNVLTIDPADGFSGEFQVDVSVTDGAETDTESFLVAVAQAASVSATDRVFAESDDQQFARRIIV